MSDVQEVTDFDLKRYLGLWFEVGRLPLRYEDDGATDVTAEYSLGDDGTVRVDNRCLDAKGEPTQALGEARVDTDHPARLEVTFLPEGLRWIPFTHADYCVLKLDEGYRHALVGTPDRDHLWLLSREPHVHPETETAFLEEAIRQGFDLKRWIRPAQSGRHVEV